MRILDRLLIRYKIRRDKEQKRERERERKKYEGREKTSVPLIHVCVHNLRDNGCSPCDIEIASVKLTYPFVHEEERRVGGSSVGRVKHKSISLHSTASREEATIGSNISKVLR